MSPPARSKAARAAHFEALFEAEADPWKTAKALPERSKRAAVLQALGPRPRALGLELGCGSGVQSEALASRFLHLDALDASAAALAHARIRLAGRPGVRLHRRSLPARPPLRGVQAVIAGEVLYYLSSAELARQITLLKPALAPGAVLVTAHSIRRHRDFAQSPQDAEAALRRAYGPPRRTRYGRGWRVRLWRAA